MKNTPLGGILLAAAMLPCMSAFAQIGTSPESGAIGATESAAVDRDLFTVEVKPLPTVLSVVPGVGAIGAGIEGNISPTSTVYLDAYFIDTNLPERIDNTAKERVDDDVYPEKLTGNSADIGARFYGAPVGSTWYTGAKLGFTAMRGEYSYKEELVDNRMSSFTPGLQAGYRWLVGPRDDIVIRLGAIASANIVQEKKTSSDRDNADVNEATRKIEDRIETPVLANIDLGLGYVF